VTPGYKQPAQLVRPSVIMPLAIVARTDLRESETVRFRGIFQQAALSLRLESTGRDLAHYALWFDANGS
jgi:hypothetical protein